MKKINAIQTGCIYHKLRLSPHSQVQKQVNSSWVFTAFMLLLAQSFKPEPNPESLHHHIWSPPPLPHWITDRSGVCDFILRKLRVGLASCKDCTVKGFIPSGNILCHFLFPCLSIVGKSKNFYPSGCRILVLNTSLPFLPTKINNFRPAAGFCSPSTELDRLSHFLLVRPDCRRKNMLNESSHPTHLDYHIPGATGRGEGVATIYHWLLASVIWTEGQKSQFLL